MKVPEFRDNACQGLYDIWKNGHLICKEKLNPPHLKMKRVLYSLIATLTIVGVIWAAFILAIKYGTPERSNRTYRQVQEPTRPAATRKQEDEPVDRKLLIKYAGEYSIHIEGVVADNTEQYILMPNGECIWKWNMAPSDTKYGRWFAERGRISMVHRGRTDDISETFTFRNGKFRSDWGNDRILVKIKDL